MHTDCCDNFMLNTAFTFFFYGFTFDSKILYLGLTCDFLVSVDISACAHWFCSSHLGSLTKNNVGDFFMMFEMLGQSHLAACIVNVFKLGQSHLAACIANVFWDLLFSVSHRQCHIKMWSEASLS